MRGIFHGYLNPSRVLETRDFRPKVRNFCTKELLKKIGGLGVEDQQEPLGASLYSAPEVLSGSDYSFASDVFSFGMTVYSILTHKEPFES